MSRDEEVEVLTAAGRCAVPGESLNRSEQEAFVEASVPVPSFAVFIDTDGSASIDGIPVQALSGQSLDEAVLDTLHQHACERNSPVTAAISDPAIKHVTFVEVAPDGSSRLVEQSAELSPAAPSPAEAAEDAVGSAEPYEPDRETREAGPSGLEAPGEANRDDSLDDFVDPSDLGDLDNRFDDDLGKSQPSLRRPSPLSFSPRVPSLPLPRRFKNSGAGAAPRQSDEEYRAPGLWHRPLVVGPVAVGVATLVILPLVLLGSGAGDGETPNKAVGASAKPDRSPARHSPASSPTVPVSPSLLLPSSSASPKVTPKPRVPSEPRATPEPGATPKPKQTMHADGAKGAAATVTVSPPEVRVTVAAKPSPDTAATAVNRLASKNPGRHICYRVYVSGQGWRKPVCDGRTAGTPGKGVITAVNIAVSGTKGTSGAAYVYDPASTNGEGHFPKPWSEVPDGLDHYLGSTKKHAPHMLGFTINVDRGAGSVCQTTYIHGGDWLGLACDEIGSGYDFTYAGTHDNDLWIEAIRLTV
ncbi:hypothetical protein AB0L67_41185 [Streptomyces flaveolus]|uniref:hypothetical protein n=1 Tax=Streptomyces flaveolus TaxID=67297 RepID=UPI00342ED840